MNSPVTIKQSEKEKEKKKKKRKKEKKGRGANTNDANFMAGDLVKKKKLKIDQLHNITTT